MRKSTWQVADVRTPLVSASHIIQAGSDLLIEKDEAHHEQQEGETNAQKGECVRALFVREGTTQRDSASHVHAHRGRCNQSSCRRKKESNEPAIEALARAIAQARQEGSQTVPERENVRWGCPGCGYLRTGQWRQQAHSEACRRKIEGLLKGDPTGSARLRLMKESIVHWLMQLSGTRPRIQE